MIEPGQTKDGYTLIVCRICGVNRYVNARAYTDLPDTCIKCSKGESR